MPFKQHGRFFVRGGSVVIGADTNLYRVDTDILKTDDGLHVAGSALIVPYGTSATTKAQNGDMQIYHKGNVGYLTFRAGGTVYSIGLPAATHGTATITVGSPP